MDIGSWIRMKTYADPKHCIKLEVVENSVAEPPLFRAAPAQDVRGPGKAAPDTNFFNFSTGKCNS